MASTIGSMVEFNETTTKWSTYQQRLEFFFEANGITDAGKKRATFIAVVGDKTYETLLGLLAPKEPKEVDFDEIVRKLNAHYSPTPNIIVERFKFYDCCISETETMSQYLARLKCLARTCRFGENEKGAALTSQAVLEECLRDKFVWEMKKNRRVQQRLLAETNLTYAKTVELASAMELAQQGVDCVSGTGAKHKSDVHKLSSHNKQFKQQHKHHKAPQQQSSHNTPTKPCFRCASTEHTANQCKYKTYTCSYCKKVGHLKSNCFGLIKKDEHSKKQHQIVHSDTNTDISTSYELYNVTDRTLPYTTDIIVDGKPVKMEIDTGAAVTIISKQTFDKHYRGGTEPTIVHSSDTLSTYTGEKISIFGIANVEVSAKGKSTQLPLTIVSGNGPTLLGRNWLDKIKINWSKINNVSTQHYEHLLRKYSQVFDLTNSKPVKGIEAKIHVPADAKPSYYKPRDIPYAIKELLDNEIDRLLSEGIIVPVTHSDWAAPVVPVVKTDRKIRLCGDYKITVNKCATNESYPLPKIEDLYAKLSGGKLFTSLDLRHAYEQLPLAIDSRKYVTINTHRGLFTYTRLPYGVSAAPSIFQRVIDSLFQGMPNVLVYLDDILITGSTVDEHLQTLEQVLLKLNTYGFHLKREKCTFMKSEVVFLGHKIDETGIHPIGPTLEAITNAKAPTNVTQLRSFIGMVNHYGRFIKQLSTKLQPLHRLLCSDVKWHWGKRQNDSFTNIKKLLVSPPIVVHYDPTKPLVLTTDASEYGIGAVLSHSTPDGEHPIACYSRTLSKAERNYSQLDKEGLAVIFGLKKSHKFVYGRHVKIHTDHKPLIKLFGEHKQIPIIITPRIQRWALTLASYDYSIIYKPGKDIPEADCMSRLPLDDTLNDNDIPVPGDTIMFFEHLDTTPLTSTKIGSMTKHDRILSNVLDMTKRGTFPRKTDDDELKPYVQRQNELSNQGDVLLWGHRVIIPPDGRRTLLNELHQTHPGIVRMKSLARSVIWWPGMDNDIEQYALNCNTCQSSRHLPAKAPLHPWVFTDRPWSRLHIDYGGPVNGKMLLIIVDSHSKWIDVHSSITSTSTVTIEHLRKTFSTHGIPDSIVSDNASCFTSDEFKHFCKMNGIKHITPAPYHPSSNGMAERAVQTVKEGLDKQREGTLETKLSRFLFNYRITPHATTNTSPAELLMKRKLKSALDLVKPDLTSSVHDKQLKQKQYHDKNTKQRNFDIGDDVFVQIHYRNQHTWLPGTVTTITGPLSYTVLLEDGRTQRCHVDQLRSRQCDTPPVEFSIPIVPTPQESTTPDTPVPKTPVRNNTPTTHTPVATPVIPVIPDRRTSSRTTAGVGPDRLNLNISKNSKHSVIRHNKP